MRRLDSVIKCAKISRKMKKVGLSQLSNFILKGSHFTSEIVVCNLLQVFAGQQLQLDFASSDKKL